MFEGIKAFMDTAAIFFNWWYLLLGLAVGIPAGAAAALLVVPGAYRAKRRHSLRVAWIMDEPREMPQYHLPHWDEYDPDDESVDSRCICHSRRVLPGQRVLLWPEVGPFGIMVTSVYCESVKEQV
jgi:hypothetical protein